MDGSSKICRFGFGTQNRYFTISRNYRFFKMIFFVIFMLLLHQNAICDDIRTDEVPDFIDEKSFRRCDQLPGEFPKDVRVKSETFLNWAEEIEVRDIKVAYPKNKDELLQVVNYAYRENLKIRAVGYKHTWAPTTVNIDDKNARQCNSLNNRVLLVSTNASFARMTMTEKNGPAVFVQSGATIDDLMEYLERNGYGLWGIPDIGQITVGGAIAIGAHGASLPYVGEQKTDGRSYGSMSNLILELTAVVWDPQSKTYGYKTFDRSDPEASAFLVNLGRTFILDVTLRVVPNYNLRCQSYVDIPASELFADPKNATRQTRTLTSFYNKAGRAELVLYPSTQNPWLKVWSVSPEKPSSSRRVTGPYNYDFTKAENLKGVFLKLYARFLAANPGAVRSFGRTSYEATKQGLEDENGYDLWGTSKNVLLWVQAQTLQLKDSGIAILTRRSNAQKVLFEVFSYYQELVKFYEDQRLYPMNGPVQCRLTGVDNPFEIGYPGAKSPGISTSSPNDNPELDTIVWFNILAIVGTTKSEEFGHLMEIFLYKNYNDPDYAVYRPEWAKDWAYTNDKAWVNKDRLYRLIPQSYPNWDSTVSTLDKYDPNRVFSNILLDNLLKAQNKIN